MSWTNYVDGLSALFEQGGMTLWAILFASVLLWILIVERYYFHWRQFPRLRRRLLDEWHAERREHPTLLPLRRIRALVDDLRGEAGKNMLALQALVAILPLLGLLGTVSGMIKVFEVITVFGSGNTRGMASGISEALVTTMAGLFTALSGMYFVSELEGRVEEAARRLESELVESQ